MVPVTLVCRHQNLVGPGTCGVFVPGSHLILLCIAFNLVEPKEYSIKRSVDVILVETTTLEFHKLSQYVSIMDPFECQNCRRLNKIFISKHCPCSQTRQGRLGDEDNCINKLLETHCSSKPLQLFYSWRKNLGGRYTQRLSITVSDHVLLYTSPLRIQSSGYMLRRLSGCQLVNVLQLLHLRFHFCFSN
jgi:hypothetical protein